VIAIRPMEVADTADDGPAVILLDAVLGGRRQVRLGEVVDVLDLAGFVAVDTTGGGRVVGTATWSPECAELACLGVAPNVRRTGVGLMLVKAVADAARSVGLERLWLSTTNDNLGALALYQRCGFGSPEWWWAGSTRPGSSSPRSRSSVRTASQSTTN
jgi:ribosomal protein S18 acetylase RimI-like enzyme